MDHLSYKTVSVNKEAANKGWVVVDAGGAAFYDFHQDAFQEAVQDSGASHAGGV